jgi:hypothetical protein
MVHLPPTPASRPAFALSTAGAAARPAKLPSHAAALAALHRAERSRALWATVNICRPSRRTVGIRGEMPSLGFPTTMRMTVRFGYFRRPGAKLTLIPRASYPVSIKGTHSTGTYQAGAEFAFQLRSPVTIAGTITFQWYLRGRLLGSTVRATRGGVKGVQHSYPRGLSAATCRL